MWCGTVCCGIMWTRIQILTQRKNATRYKTTQGNRRQKTKRTTPQIKTHHNATQKKTIQNKGSTFEESPKWNLPLSKNANQLNGVYIWAPGAILHVFSCMCVYVCFAAEVEHSRPETLKRMCFCVFSAFGGPKGRTWPKKGLKQYENSCFEHFLGRVFFF